MSRHCLLTLLVLLVAPAASAQDEKAKPPYEDEYAGYEVQVEDPGPPRLKGASRFSLQTGWRYTPNTKFFDRYYALPENRRLTRAGGAIGGPLVTATFAYSPLDWLEVGLDLFFTYERMQLTNSPGLNAISFGLAGGLRFQKRMELGAREFVPYFGVLLGPTFAGAFFDGGNSVENFAQTMGATVGGKLRLSPKWGLNIEYRLTLAQGQVDRLGIYNAGGHWLTVGLSYYFPLIKDHPLSRDRHQLKHSPAR
jgi:hypothetical protein